MSNFSYYYADAAAFMASFETELVSSCTDVRADFENFPDTFTT
jgi:hypothetical protein